MSETKFHTHTDIHNYNDYKYSAEVYTYKCLPALTEQANVRERGTISQHVAAVILFTVFFSNEMFKLYLPKHFQCKCDEGRKGITIKEVGME
jgi:hypothetical protein